MTNRKSLQGCKKKQDQPRQRDGEQRTPEDPGRSLLKEMKPFLDPIGWASLGEQQFSPGGL
jgi:hypothetical protein